MKSTTFQEPSWVSLKGGLTPSLDHVRIAPCLAKENKISLGVDVGLELESLHMLQQQLSVSPLADRGGFVIHIDPQGVVWALINLGEPEKISIEFILKSFASLGRFLLKKNHSKWFLESFPISFSREFAVKTALQALLLAQYPISKTGLQTVDIASVYPREKSWSFLEAQSYGVHLARGMINANADLMNPSKMAEIAIALAQKHKEQGVECYVLDEKEMAAEGMGLLLAVSRASRTPARLVVLKYTPQNQKNLEAPIAWIGKGISYDTGGFSLKPQDSMKVQRSDMSGAATVLGAFEAAVRLELNQPLLAVLVCAENAIGSDGYKLGDVYVSRSGKTVEVVNTDAEGRLVLADAFDYVQDKFSPKIMIDLATLTGAAIVALGHEAAAILSDDEKLKNHLIESAKKSGERLWPMPLYDEYKEYLSSDIADMKNAGPRIAGTCVAAVFLKQFVREGVSWAHLDIAGVAFAEKELFHFHRLATGFGVGTLLNSILN